MSEQPRRRARHLMDPSQPRRRATPEELERLGRVQRTVISVLVVTTIVHLSIGLLIAAVAIDPVYREARLGISLLAGAFGLSAVVSALAIHRRPMLSPWLVLGVLPAVVGVWLVLAGH